ncbi:MAG TPA: DUF6799 domain-containing protein [Planctomycetota bacterium]|nr:DUF6799 domain-containing protein [Planctomycetota bacterium]
MSRIAGLFFIALFLALVVPSIRAEETPKPGETAPQPKPEFLLMRDGKMMHSKDGKETALEKDMTFPNGTTLSVDGKVVFAGGRKKTLKDGDKMYMDGREEAMNNPRP